MRRVLLATIAATMLGGIGVAVAAPTSPTIFCPIFPDPTVQTVAHAVCTHTPH